jgi:hypothetical protein
MNSGSIFLGVFFSIEVAWKRVFLNVEKHTQMETKINVLLLFLEG